MYSYFNKEADTIPVKLFLQEVGWLVKGNLSTRSRGSNRLREIYTSRDAVLLCAKPAEDILLGPQADSQLGLVVCIRLCHGA